LTAAGGVLAAAAFKPSPKTSFFVTSVGSGKGGDLGGLAGADAHCTSLATAAGIKGKTWHAYLSSSAGNARDRIGKGPWYNVNGVEMASSVDDLHSVNNELSKANSLTEKGGVVNGVGDTPNQHDILTGSDAEGKLAAPVGRTPPNSPPGTPPGPAPANMTCNDWTSSEGGGTMLGHNDRKGGGPAATSWNASHAAAGCSQPQLVQTGGNGLFYCFATN
jgi:hypothetical protein